MLCRIKRLFCLTLAQFHTAQIGSFLMKISIVSTGFEGLATSACLAEVGHDVL